MKTILALIALYCIASVSSISIGDIKETPKDLLTNSEVSMQEFDTMLGELESLEEQLRFIKKITKAVKNTINKVVPIGILLLLMIINKEIE
jgi:hypothetical protein